jgi:hypothetical protein
MKHRIFKKNQNWRAFITVGIDRYNFKVLGGRDTFLVLIGHNKNTRRAGSQTYIFSRPRQLLFDK